MSVATILSWIVCGLLVGLCARILVPGRQSMTLPMTILLGIVGAFAGGFLYSVVWGVSGQPFSFSDRNWYGWTVAILGAVLVLWGSALVYPRKWWQ